MRQLLALAFPLMLMGFIQMAYNLVDLAWLGRLGSHSVAAVGSSGLYMWMTSSIALISKIGAEITIGQSIGAKRIDKASRYASHTTTIALAIGAFFGLLFFFQSPLFIQFFNLQPSIATEAANYLQIVAIGMPFMFLISNFSGIYVGIGRSKIPFWFNSIGLVLNIVLDPIGIFTLGLGSRGAAIATTVSQAVVCILFVWHLKKHHILCNFPLVTKLKPSYTKHILKIGLPIATMNACFSLINMTLVKISGSVGGHLAVTSQTTGGQVEGITWNTAMGFATALGSFVAQNYAARQLDRVKQAYRYTLMLMGAFGSLVSLLFIFGGEFLFGLLVPERDAYIAGGQYLFVLGFSQVFMMLDMTTEGMFNGFGKTMPPAVVSIVFNVLRIPLALIFSAYFGILGVWWAITTSSILKGTVLFVWYLFLQRKIDRQLSASTAL